MTFTTADTRLLLEALKGSYSELSAAEEMDILYPSGDLLSQIEDAIVILEKALGR